uniref:Pecanex-like protein n=1 Tax=Ditylenchus dipsaci TaxID=166011 RepID=A0A915DUD4_9BILA
MAIMEQIDMHLFGATASFSLLSALLSLLKSISAWIYSNHCLFRFRLTDYFHCFLLLRWSSNPLGFQLLFEHFFPSKSGGVTQRSSAISERRQSICSASSTNTKHFNSFCCTKFTNKSGLSDVETAIAYGAQLPAHSPALPQKGKVPAKKNSLTSSSLSSSLAKPHISPTVETVDGDVEDRQTTTVGDMSDLFCLDEEKSAHFSANEAGCSSGGAHFAKSNARPSLYTDPLPEILKKTLLIRLHHDTFYFFINTLIIFGVHSTSLFLSAQPYFEMVICLLCIFSEFQITTFILNCAPTLRGNCSPDQF